MQAGKHGFENTRYVYQPTECPWHLFVLQRHTLGEISNIDVREKSVLRVLKYNNCKRNGDRSTRSEHKWWWWEPFCVQATQRAARQCITETLRVKVRQGFKKLPGMSEIIYIYIYIYIINIQGWAIWPVPSPELQLLSPSFLRSPNSSLSLWAVVDIYICRSQ